VAFYSDPNEWEDPQKLTRPAKREDALRDFQAFGPIARKILGLVEPELDVVSYPNHSRRLSRS